MPIIVGILTFMSRINSCSFELTKLNLSTKKALKPQGHHHQVKSVSHSLFNGELRTSNFFHADTHRLDGCPADPSLS